MIERGGELPVTRQAELLGLSRSSVYYVARPLPERDLVLMRRLDELHLAHPFLGSRKLAEQLRREGHEVGRRHVRTLMQRMGIETIFRKPRTSLPAREATIYPYLLGEVKIERPNQVWASDITYLPMAHGFLYLAAIIDVYSRKVLAWRLSNTLTADFCVEALSEALGTYGAPAMFNTDQGAQPGLKRSSQRSSSLASYTEVFMEPRSDANASEVRGRGCASLSAQARVQCLSRSAPAECHSRSAVERDRDGVELTLRVAAQVRAFREVLPQQTVRVLVRPSLPRAARIAEIDCQPGIDSKLSMLSELGALIPGQRTSQVRWQRLDLLGDRIPNGGRTPPGQGRTVLHTAPGHMPPHTRQVQ